MYARLAIAAAIALSPSVYAGRAEPKVKDAWRPAAASEVGGILGERLQLWREKRLWLVADWPDLVRAFEGGPGSHQTAPQGNIGQGENPGSSPLWQGEHVGKWLHAATLAQAATENPKLLARLRETVRRLVAAQEENGYLGTYAPAKRFYAPPDADTWRSWDIWTQRYNIYGLLAWDEFHPDAAAVRACERMAALLAGTFGSGRRDITTVGTRSGMSSTTLLESIVMLYERTGDRRFLDFAERIVASSEANPKLRLLSAMLERADVSIPGDGKAYQLMANLLGYGDLYRMTGRPDYLRAVVNGWENIRAGHLYESGGPWSFAHVSHKNNECFAPPELFDPAHPVETCSVTTWVQLSLQLLRITGQARYAAEAERAVLNQVMAAQAPDGIGWSTHPGANTANRRYVKGVNCCASSGPRALEMFARHLAGISGEAIAIASYLPMRVAIPGRGVTVEVSGDYPFASRAAVRFEMRKPAAFPVDFAPPAGARSVTVLIEGRPQAAEKTPSGFYRVRRTWRAGERIEVRFDFPIETHYHAGRNGRRWVSFTRGPVVLAQQTTAVDGPFEVPGDAAGLVEQAGPQAFRITNGPALVPYYQAGSTTGGVRTYFPVAGN